MLDEGSELKKTLPEPDDGFRLRGVRFADVADALTADGGWFVDLEGIAVVIGGGFCVPAEDGAAESGGVGAFFDGKTGGATGEVAFLTGVGSVSMSSGALGMIWFVGVDDGSSTSSSFTFESEEGGIGRTFGEADGTASRSIPMGESGLSPKSNRGF